MLDGKGILFVSGKVALVVPAAKLTIANIMKGIARSCVLPKSATNGAAILPRRPNVEHIPVVKVLQCVGNNSVVNE